MIGYERLVRLRQGLWQDFEALLARARRDPGSFGFRDLETLALHYRQVLHDHALVSSRFPGTAAAARLRSLVIDGTRWIQRDPAGGRWSLGRFFRDSFPRAVRRSLPELGVSFGLFAVAVALGLFVSGARPGIGTVFLGPSAIERLRQGHLWTESLLSTAPPAWVSSSIATNNMSVAIVAFAGGAAAGLGSLYVVLLNGLLLGTVLGTTRHYGMAMALLEFISAHGPLEITLILVTAGSGLVMGRAIVQATDRPRREVMREAGGIATTVLGGCLPWFLLLAFVEAYLSPSRELPAGLKALVGAALLLGFLSTALRTPAKEDSP